MGGCTRGYGNGFLKLSVVCTVTKLKVLEFFSGLEFFRTCARSQGSAVRKKLFLASMRRSHGQWPRARWKVAKRCEQRARQTAAQKQQQIAELEERAVLFGDPVGRTGDCVPGAAGCWDAPTKRPRVHCTL